MNGICTLGNDRVYDQLVALINSIEAWAGPEMPICIYPYDDRLDHIQHLVAQRPQVQLYDDRVSLQRWDAVVEALWATHPSATAQWQAAGSSGIHRMGTHRRYCAFDGPFDRFLYMDADTLLLSSPEVAFTALEQYDWVTYDFQHKDLSHVYSLNSPQLRQLFSAEQLRRQAFLLRILWQPAGPVHPRDLPTGHAVAAGWGSRGALPHGPGPDPAELPGHAHRSQLL
jgi:hypothetical protein